ncbi:MAG: phosphoribosylglycinamide formyltransferase [Bacteroidetes bacterium RBG_13_43_22]|nr:MAG: phosphoribosylglycinamide formyltransferase [Bacteroidetes bacterium RBG_13_43_22]
MRNIAILASGSGTNAENIIKYFSNSKTAEVKLVLSNRREAFVLKRAEAFKVKSCFFDRNDFYTSGKVLNILAENRIDFIVLAGFLWLVPGSLLEKYEGRIVNIHPALLPRYGGKGMYGEKVHNAVLANHDAESGITIHYVNKRYDEGDIIFQAKCKVENNDTADSLAARVHALEYEHFPKVIENLIINL